MLVLLENGDDAKENEEFFKQNLFLVPDGFDEAEYADKVITVYDALRSGKNKSKNKTFFTVLTTTDCNARCCYCYEAGVKHCRMSADTAKDAVKYIVSASGMEDVSLRFFGGEPLINIEAIDLICEGLRAAGVKYRSDMVSNGYCLDRSVIEKAVTLWNLKDIQITLDGTSEVYNRVKAYKNGDTDAYSRVIQNIKNALEAGIKVHIRMNVGDANLNGLTELADELALTFPDKKGLFVYTSLLGDFRENANRFSNGKSDAESYLKLKEKLKESGLGKGLSPITREPKPNNCAADNDSCEIILPDGRLCKCDVLLGKDCYGDIYSYKRDGGDIESWKQRVRLPECFDCPLYPRCINLKKCPWVGDNCKETIQKIRICNLREQITEAYKNSKENMQ